MAQHILGTFKAGLGPDDRCGRVPQLARRPVGQASQGTGPADGLSITRPGVVVTWLFAWIFLAPVYLRGLHGGTSVTALARAQGRDGLTRREKIRLGLPACQERRQRFLRPRAEKDFPRLAPPFVLVAA